MHRIDSEMAVMRIYLGERDRCGHRSLSASLVELLRQEKFAGATVFKGTMGFGAHSVTHGERLLDLSGDLPIVIEVVETEAKIATFLPRLDTLMSGGLVTVEKVRAIRYLPPPAAGC